MFYLMGMGDLGLPSVLKGPKIAKDKTQAFCMQSRL